MGSRALSETQRKQPFTQRERERTRIIEIDHLNFFCFLMAPKKKATAQTSAAAAKSAPRPFSQLPPAGEQHAELVMAWLVTAISHLPAADQVTRATALAVTLARRLGISGMADAVMGVDGKTISAARNRHGFARARPRMGFAASAATHTSRNFFDSYRRASGPRRALMCSWCGGAGWRWLTPSINSRRVAPKIGSPM
jgi:hypothetical protein